MDNKNNRLFYWNVKDFMERNPIAFEQKRESLKDTVSKILNENAVYRTTNFSQNKNLTEQVNRQIERISIDENKYVSKDTKQKTNSLSNPFYLSEALATTRRNLGRGKLTSVSSLTSDGYSPSDVPSEEDSSTPSETAPARSSFLTSPAIKGKIPEVLPYSLDTETPSIAPGAGPLPSTAPRPTPMPAPSVTPTPAPAPSGTTPTPTPRPTPAPSATTPTPTPTPAPAPSGTTPTPTPAPAPSGVSPTTPATLAFPGISTTGPADTGFDFTKAGTGVGKPTGSTTTTTTTTTTSTSRGLKFNDDAYSTMCGGRMHLAQCAAAKRREASIARSKINSAKNKPLAEQNADKAAELARQANDLYQAWKVEWLRDNPKDRRSLYDFEVSVGYSTRPDLHVGPAETNKGYWDTIRQQENAKNMLDQQKRQADAKRALAAPETEKIRQEKANALQMAKELGMSVEELMQKSPYFRENFGHLFPAT